ncbi:MAG: glycosidase [Verrucomicrobiota bacterium]
MSEPLFEQRVAAVRAAHETLLSRPNPVDPDWDNGVFERFVHPVVTAAHTPLEWRYDFNPKTNPFFMERMGINATTNPGAFYWQGRCHMVVRTEGYDRKSFFAICESESGTEGFRFWDEPVQIPPLEGETNLYDMRVVFHEDGWIYGVFCAESKDPKAGPGDLSSAVAQAGLARTKDFRNWERLPNLKTPASQQRNVVLHPEFVDGQYAFYTRPMDGFIDVGAGGGIGWTLCQDITEGTTGPEKIILGRHYHGIMEAKNGDGPAPIKTDRGWLHMAHGVRNCASGLRYVLYMFVADLEDPSHVIAQPGGYFLAPFKSEGLGDVMDVTFCNGWLQKPDGEVLVYYGASDTWCYVVRTSVEKLLDWCFHTPEDGLTTHGVVAQRLDLIRQNRTLLGG